MNKRNIYAYQQGEVFLIVRWIIVDRFFQVDIPCVGVNTKGAIIAVLQPVSNGIVGQSGVSISGYDPGKIGQTSAIWKTKIKAKLGLQSHKILLALKAKQTEKNANMIVVNLAADVNILQILLYQRGKQVAQGQ